MKITNKNKVILLSIIGSLILILSISYAFFKPIIDKEKSTRVDVVAKTIDQFMFIQGDSINLELDHLNFAEGMPNITGSTTTTAKLVANNKTNEAEQTYYVYFYIGKNEFDYSTDEEEPEIILTLKDPNGNNITNLDNLTYVTKSDVSGFDITNYKGLITVAEEYEIETTSSTAGTSQEWEAIVTVRNLDINQTQLAGNTLKAQFVLSSEEKEHFTFGDLILANNGGKTYIETKSHAFNTTSEDNDGMYAMADDYTSTTGNNSYYFRGAVDNNWVKFGKEDNKDIWWRIVRINGDGSVKLIYTGTTGPQDELEKVVMLENASPPYTKTQIGTSAFNAEYNKGEYIGYMYEEEVHRGHVTSSTIKQTLDTWYTNNLKDYEEYLSDFVVCNDRGFPNNWEPIGLPTSGEGTQYSDVYGRLRTTNAPQLMCPHKEDRYTVNDAIIGNGELTYPIGLLTADEATLAGGYRTSANSSYYLYTNQYYWLVSPFYVSTISAVEFVVYSSGFMDGNAVSNISGVRPAVSLSSDLSVSGSGQWNDPYVVE